MKLVEYRQESSLEELRPAWKALLSRSGSNTIFLTPEWIEAWWHSFGTPGELRITAAYDEQGTLCGIAPLRARIARKYGQTVSTLAFIGDYSNDSEYLDLIVTPGYEKQVCEA